MYILSLEIINKCNLNCSYCYLGEKKNTYMSLYTMERAVDIAIHETQKQYDKTLLVYFIGGEPLMAIKSMENAVSYVKRRCQEMGLKYIFSTTSNGTLLSESAVNFFINNKFDLKLSIDRPQYVHDLNRKDYSGNGSFLAISKNFNYLKEYEEETRKKISYAQVITKNNYKFWKESFQFLLDIGAEKIESSIDHYCIWGNTEIRELKEVAKEVFYLYKKEILCNNKSLFWNMFDQTLEAYLLPCDYYACKAGLNNIFVNTDGNIYTCIELPQFYIGNVTTGLDVHKIREIVYVKDIESKICVECIYKKNCKTRGCQASNFEVNNNIYKPVKVNCEVTKTMFDLVEKNVPRERIANLKEMVKKRRGQFETKK